MPNLNRHCVIGHMSADPEVRYSPSGMAVCKFTVATNRGRDEKKQTDWNRCVAFGWYAEETGRRFKKGSAIHVEGPSTTSSWEDSQGVKRYQTETVVNYLAVPLYERKEKTDTQPVKQEDQQTHQGSVGDIPF